MENQARNPFLSRIGREKALIETPFFRVVVDSHPILRDHYLLYSTHEIAAFSEANIDAFANFVRKDLVEFFGNNFVILERGKLPSCTGGPVIHAHAHIVPRNLASQLRAGIGELDKSRLLFEGLLGEALLIARPKSRYLMMVMPNMESSIWEIDGEHAKSIARTLITNCLERENESLLSVIAVK